MTARPDILTVLVILPCLAFLSHLHSEIKSQQKVANICNPIEFKFSLVHLKEFNKPAMHFVQWQALLAKIQLVFQHSKLSAEKRLYLEHFSGNSVQNYFLFHHKTNYVGYKHIKQMIIQAINYHSLINSDCFSEGQRKKNRYEGYFEGAT